MIAEDLGISKSWASRLHERAITALGRALRSMLESLLTKLREGVWRALKER